MKKIMVAAPHYDDEIIGCGGTLIKKIAVGDEVTTIYFTQGFSGVVDTDLSFEQKNTKRKKEMEKVCSLLNMKKICLDLPDRQFEYSAVIVEKLVNYIANYKPNEVFIPYENDIDREHYLVNKMMKDAIWMAEAKVNFCDNYIDDCFISDIYEYEVWTPISDVNYINPIDEVIQKKMLILSCYYSQITDKDYVAAFKGLNSYRGIIHHSRCQFAEAFKVLHKA